ncbi:transposase, partial [Halorubrum sp. SS5]
RTVPYQSTLWRTWNERFTRDLRETVQKAARTILIKAQNADVAVPRDPERNLPDRAHDAAESDPDNQAILDKSGKITDHVGRVVFPTFSLNRGEGCEIPENAYWGLQTYLGLRE